MAGEFAQAIADGELALKNVRADYDFDCSKWAAGPAYARSLTALNVVAEIVLDAAAGLGRRQMKNAALLALEARQRCVVARVCRAVRDGCTLRTLRGMEDLKAAIHLRGCLPLGCARIRLTVAVEMF